ncbi:MAG TPA: NAD(P)H-dependent oxidoreductase subunit E [Myxococcales bacterium]|jgi:[NiFe] hydrogenase diaphorase moiety large subunit
MNSTLQQVVKDVTTRVGRDKNRLMDVVRDIQAQLGCVSGEAIDLVARELNTSRVAVEGVVSFYAFLSKQQKGHAVIRLSECPSCLGAKGHETAEALKKALGIDFGQTTPDGHITLEHTSCVGLCDQGPAGMVNGLLVAGVTPEKVGSLVKAVREKPSALSSFAPQDNLRKRGPVVMAGMESGAAIRKALRMSPANVIAEMKTSKLRGRGGAGFPTGTKWEFARNAAGDKKVVICNADEGEPGTFKDRVILNLVPELVFEGMAVAGYAIGATEGILYLRGEYEFLKDKLDKTLEFLRSKNLLGKNLCGQAGVDFDIRVQLGAGAYVCGEESALISSCEGGRGVPKNRPPFPVEKGYLGLPTSVNNVETLCCAARIMEKGATWFVGFGTKDSTGTKLFSVSGDCQNPGVYELPFGITLQELLKEVGGEGAQAILVGGPSGQFVAPMDFGKKISFEGVATGGSMVVFGAKKDLLSAVSAYMHFFVEESCGYCVPCRVGNVLLTQKLDAIRAGKGTAEDLAYLEELCVTTKKMSRCGLGQTSPNPIHTTLSSFRALYEARLVKAEKGRVPAFDLDAALAEAAKLQGRAPVYHED